METKLLELRDRATFIPVLAVNCGGSFNQYERWLLRRAGYACDGYPIVMLTALGGGCIANYDPHTWGGRTFPVAHAFITEHWSELASGDVVDVEHILGETAERKVSERED